MNQVLDAAKIQRRLAESGVSIGGLAGLASTSYGATANAFHGRPVRIGVALRIARALEALTPIPELAAYLPSQ